MSQTANQHEPTPTEEGGSRSGSSDCYPSFRSMVALRLGVIEQSEESLLNTLGVVMQEFEERGERLRGRWTSTDDRLPDDDICVLVFVPEQDEPVWLAYFSEDDWRYVSGGTCYPSHWMELPDPPVLDG